MASSSNALKETNKFCATPQRSKATKIIEDKLIETKSKSQTKKSLESAHISTKPVPGKAFSFNPDTAETSVGGTLTHGVIKQPQGTDAANPGDLPPRPIPVQNIVGKCSAAKSTNGVQIMVKSAPEKCTPCAADVKFQKPQRPETNSEMPSNKLERPHKLLTTPTSTQSVQLDSSSKPDGFARNNLSTPAKYDVTSSVGKPISRAASTTPLRRYTADFETPDCFSAVAFDTPLTKATVKRRSDVQMYVEDSSQMTVAVRVRPLTSRETADTDVKCVLSVIDNETIVTPEKGVAIRFTYDHSFWSFDRSDEHYADQLTVYDALARPLIDKVFEGYNTCLFAYGQTGSGKSYSIMGYGEEVGIVPRFCEDLVSRIENRADDGVRMNIEISFFEIYNEKIHDLLGESNMTGRDKGAPKKPNLKVREHPLLGPYVEGLSSYVVESFEDISSWLGVGNKRRATAATGMNDNSSRSHSVFTMLLTQTRVDNIEGEMHEHNITSKINLVDLAGSERQTLAKTSGDRLREGASINKSLHNLGKVISVLAEQPAMAAKKKKVPTATLR